MQLCALPCAYFLWKCSIFLIWKCIFLMKVHAVSLWMASSLRPSPRCETALISLQLHNAKSPPAKSSTIHTRDNAWARLLVKQKEIVFQIQMKERLWNKAGRVWKIIAHCSGTLLSKIHCGEGGLIYAACVACFFFAKCGINKCGFNWTCADTGVTRLCCNVQCFPPDCTEVYCMLVRFPNCQWVGEPD